jgi:hypothetical protein
MMSGVGYWSHVFTRGKLTGLVTGWLGGSILPAQARYRRRGYIISGFWIPKVLYYAFTLFHVDGHDWFWFSAVDLLDVDDSRLGLIRERDIYVVPTYIYIYPSNLKTNKINSVL